MTLAARPLSRGSRRAADPGFRIGGGDACSRPALAGPAPGSRKHTVRHGAPLRFRADGLISSIFLSLPKPVRGTRSSAACTPNARKHFQYMFAGGANAAFRELTSVRGISAWYARVRTKGS